MEEKDYSEQNTQMPQKPEKKKGNVLMWILLVLFPPIGIIYMWIAKKEMETKKKVILTVIFMIWMFIGIAVGGNQDTNTTTTNQTATQSSKDIENAELGVNYMGSLEAGTVLDNNADFIVFLKYPDGTQENVTGWTIDPVVTLQEGVQSTFNVNYNGKTKQMSLTGQRPVTVGEKNALQKAEDYLDYAPFSYTGLIGQLEYEGYTTQEATYAADNCGADWNEQAAKKAEDYMNYSSFSRQGLIDQLMFEGYTQEQAEYGVTAVGY